MYKRNNYRSKILPGGTLDTTLTSLLRKPSLNHNVHWSIWLKLCQHRQQRTSYTHRAELKKIPWWVTVSKAVLESIGTILASCPLSTHFAVHGTAQMYITGTQTFLISKLGGWSTILCSTNRPRRTEHQKLKHLRHYWCYGDRSVIGNRGWRGTFRNRGDIGLSPANWETIQTKKPPYHYAESGAQHHKFSWKIRKYSQWVSATIWPPPSVGHPSLLRYTYPTPDRRERTSLGIRLLCCTIPTLPLTERGYESLGQRWLCCDTPTYTWQEGCASLGLL